MGKTLEEWREILEQKDSKDLRKFVEGVENAMDIAEINEEYGWTGLKGLQYLAEKILKERNKEDKNEQPKKKD